MGSLVLSDIRSCYCPQSLSDPMSATTRTALTITHTMITTAAAPAVTLSTGTVRLPSIPLQTTITDCYAKAQRLLTNAFPELWRELAELHAAPILQVRGRGSGGGLVAGVVCRGRLVAVVVGGDSLQW
jgi:hypothetical protein